MQRESYLLSIFTKRFQFSVKSLLSLKRELADVRGFAGSVGSNGLRFRESRCYTVIDLIKGHAVMSEVITHCGKMWCFLLQAVPQKPAVRIVEGDLLRSPPQGRQFPVP